MSAQGKLGIPGLMVTGTLTLACGAVVGDATDTRALGDGGPAARDGAASTHFGDGGAASGKAGAEPSGAGGASVAGSGGSRPVDGSAAGNGGSQQDGSILGSAGGGAPTPGRLPFDAGSDPDRHRVEPGQVCERVAAIICAGEAHCCDERNRTIEQCESAVAGVCSDDLFVDAMSANPITGYSAGAAEAAFEEFERRASECDPTIMQWVISSEGFRNVARGTIAEGDECTPPSLFDRVERAGYFATCRGQSHCLPVPQGPWTCQPPSGEGSPCYTDFNCHESLYCDNPDRSPSSEDRCRPREPDGSPCALPNECKSLACRGRVCVAATRTTTYCAAN